MSQLTKNQEYTGLEERIQAEEAAAILSPTKVEKIFTECLFRDFDEGAKAVSVENTSLIEIDDKADEVNIEGITHTAVFHRGRLEKHKSEVFAMLLELPAEFMVSGGGGYSFLNACMDKNGRQWTGVHFMMEKLFMLGLAIGKVKLLLPRSVWPALPGGMPYYAVVDQ